MVFLSDAPILAATADRSERLLAAGVNLHGLQVEVDSESASAQPRTASRHAAYELAAMPIDIPKSASP